MDVRFYLDVHDVQRKNVTDANVTYVLKRATTNYGFQPLEVESNSITLAHVVVRELSLISEERLCEREREREGGGDRERERTLQESFLLRPGPSFSKRG